MYLVIYTFIMPNGRTWNEYLTIGSYSDKGMGADYLIETYINRMKAIGADHFLDKPDRITVLQNGTEVPVVVEDLG